MLDDQPCQGHASEPPYPRGQATSVVPAGCRGQASKGQSGTFDSGSGKMQSWNFSSTSDKTSNPNRTCCWAAALLRRRSIHPKLVEAPELEADISRLQQERRGRKLKRSGKTAKLSGDQPSQSSRSRENRDRSPEMAGRIESFLSVFSLDKNRDASDVKVYR